MKPDSEQIRKDLLSMQDPEYRAFLLPLIPTVTPDSVIGIRLPVLRAYAKQLAKCGDPADFLRSLPHRYFEEYHLHSFLIGELKDFDRVTEELDLLLPYVDNWSVCDSITPKILSGHQKALLPHVRRWIGSKEPYAVRFGVLCLMRHYLGEAFSEEIFQLAASVRSDHYYVNMAVAWFFATALSVRFEETLPCLAKGFLPPFTRKKAIQKAIESRRLSGEQKQILKNLR